MVRIFHIRNAPAVQQFQEIAVAVRTTAEIRRMYTYNAGRAVVARGTAGQVALAEWLINELDKPAEGTRQHSSADEYRVPAQVRIDEKGWDADDVARVFYTAHAATVQDFQEMATLIRTMTDIRRVFTYNELRAMTLRSTAGQIVMAEWLFNQLDRQAPARSAALEYRAPANADDVLRVFYLPAGGTVQEFQKTATRVRTETGIRRVFTYNAPRALALRGTAAQIAMAARMIADAPGTAQ
jgi:hypothetical protein